MGTKMKLSRIVLLTALCLLLTHRTYAATTYTFNCSDSSIKGAISYSVIGTYRAVFKGCSGRIVYDDLRRKMLSVDMSISIGSIVSNCRWCDNIAKSKRVLDAARWPSITFKSRDLKNDKLGWQACGLLSMHGRVQHFCSPFKMDGKKDNVLFLSGAWKFNRKDYRIIWNKWLDHGGIVVADEVMVPWRIKAHLTASHTHGH